MQTLQALIAQEVDGANATDVVQRGGADDESGKYRDHAEECLKRANATSAGRVAICGRWIAKVGTNGGGDQRDRTTSPPYIICGFMKNGRKPDLGAANGGGKS